MPHKIQTFRSLLHLVALDETDHKMRAMADLLVSALRDWGNCQDIASCIAGFKAYFGDPLTVENTRSYTGRDMEDWSWRGEAGMYLSEMIQRSIDAYQIADFDTIVDRLLTYYEQKFFLTSTGKPLSDTGFASFRVYSENLTSADVAQWLGADYEDIQIPLTTNRRGGLLVRQVVEKLLPFKDRLVALKQAMPEVHYTLTVVVWSTLTHFDLDSESMRLLGEIGARLDSEIFFLPPSPYHPPRNKK